MLAVTATTSGPKALGMTWRSMMCHFGSAKRARRQNIVLLVDAQALARAPAAPSPGQAIRAKSAEDEHVIQPERIQVKGIFCLFVEQNQTS